MEAAAMEMHYRTLGVKRKASQEEVRKAFLALAVRLHPDKPGGSVEQFQRAQTAYEVLGNRESRAVYDAELNEYGSKLRGFKRPPPLAEVRLPVHYKLADDKYYTFESAPARLKCTFRHGDIICLNGQMGCFVGLAADNYLYWCRDSHSYASKLCEKGSFGEDTVKVISRANFKTNTSSRIFPSFIPTGAKGVAEGSRASFRDSAEARGRGSSVDNAAAPEGATASNSGKPRPLSEAERLRQNIMRRERLRYLQECIASLPQRERVERERIMNQMETVLQNAQQEFRDWLHTCNC